MHKKGSFCQRKMISKMLKMLLPLWFTEEEKNDTGFRWENDSRCIFWVTPLTSILIKLNVKLNCFHYSQYKTILVHACFLVVASDGKLYQEKVQSMMYLRHSSSGGKSACSSVVSLSPSVFTEMPADGNASLPPTSPKTRGQHHLQSH